MEKLFELLENCCPTVDFKTEKELVSGKVIDSVDLVSIISDIEDEFGVNIDIAEIDPSNFDSAEQMWALIESLR